MGDEKEVEVTQPPTNPNPHLYLIPFNPVLVDEFLVWLLVCR